MLSNERETGCWRCKRHFTAGIFDESTKCLTCGWDYCPHCGACQRHCREFRERVQLSHPETRRVWQTTMLAGR